MKVLETQSNTLHASNHTCWGMWVDTSCQGYVGMVVGHGWGMLVRVGCFLHQSKTTTRQRKKNVEPVHSYDASYTRSGNDKTNMVRQRQDNTKLNHVHLLSCRMIVGWEKGRLPRWLAGGWPLRHGEANCYKRWSPPSPPPLESSVCLVVVFLV